MRLDRPFLISTLAFFKVVIAAVVLLFVSQDVLDNGLGATEVSLIAFAVIAITCAIGLWRLRPYGWWLQIVFSLIGLVAAFPVSTVCSAMLLGYFFRRGTRIMFSGRRSESLRQEEVEALVEIDLMPRSHSTFFAVAIILLPMLYTACVATILIPNLLGSIDRGKQKRTMADMKRLGASLEAYSIDHKAYPTANSIEELVRQLSPKYIKGVTKSDGWGTRYEVISSPEEYTIYSRGRDRVGSNCEPNVTLGFSDEICLRNGRFIRYPQGIQQ